MNAFPSLLAAITAAPEKIPDLKPPRGEILPTLWEAHGWALGALAVVALLLLAAIVQRLRQPKPVVLPTLADRARVELTALRAQGDAASINTGAARVLRRFLIAKFGLAGPGLTPDEIAAHLPTNEALTAELHRFLHQCDVANFAPATPAPPADAVIVETLGLIDTVERQTPPPLPMARLAHLKSA
jgi:hypothetical protein